LPIMAGPMWPIHLLSIFKNVLQARIPL
jgi:hypothetical protein